jgi:hypothetical protein
MSYFKTEEEPLIVTRIYPSALIVSDKLPILYKDEEHINRAISELLTIPTSLLRSEYIEKYQLFIFSTLGDNGKYNTVANKLYMHNAKQKWPKPLREVVCFIGYNEKSGYFSCPSEKLLNLFGFDRNEQIRFDRNEQVQEEPKPVQEEPKQVQEEPKPVQEEPKQVQEEPKPILIELVDIPLKVLEEVYRRIETPKVVIEDRKELTFEEEAPEPVLKKTKRKPVRIDTEPPRRSSRLASKK